MTDGCFHPNICSVLHLQVQNLAMRGLSGPKGVGVKTEAPERSDSGRKERRGIKHINELCNALKVVYDDGACGGFGRNFRSVHLIWTLSF